MTVSRVKRKSPLHRNDRREQEVIGIVDRFEDKYAVIEIEGVMKDVPREQVARTVSSGDVVEFLNGIWITNKSATERRTQEIKKLMDDVWED
ncbi:DUF3006 domain-containing protein [Paenibacillus marinisediminis]